jgi:hypothetical protein
METGQVVVVTNIHKESSDEQYHELKQFIGFSGIILDIDYTPNGNVYHVQLDVYNTIHELEDDDTQAFLGSELEAIGGGEEEEMSSFDITPKYVLKQKDLSPKEKLAFIVINEEAPCDLETLCQRADLLFDDALNVVDKLIDLGFIVEAVGTRNIFYPTFHLERMGTVKKEKGENEKTVMTDADADLLRLMYEVEEYYKKRGVSHKISKNGKKVLKKTVTYLNNVWKKKEEFDSHGEFQSKGDLYLSYLEYVFQNLDDDDLKQLKRLTFTGNKGAWRKTLNSPHTGQFIPYFFNYQWSETHYYGINKNEIPGYDDVNDSMYCTTVEVFLHSKWRTKTYPVCKQVLYALECVIIHHLFRNRDARDLISKHKIYVREYKTAEARDKLDNLTDYVKHNKKNSNVCHNCKKRGDCVNDKVTVISCDEREETRPKG